jgi:hypothetical protein
MIEIRNKQRFPIPLILKSKNYQKGITHKILPGIGKGKNIFVIEDEQFTAYITEAEKRGWISVKKITAKDSRR